MPGAVPSHRVQHNGLESRTGSDSNLLRWPVSREAYIPVSGIMRSWRASKANQVDNKKM